MISFNFSIYFIFYQIQKNGSSNIRGTLKDKIRPFIAVFGFKSAGENDDFEDVASVNRKLYNHLIDNLNFTFVKSDPTVRLHDSYKY